MHRKNPRIPALMALLAALMVTHAAADIGPPPPVDWALDQNDPNPFDRATTTRIGFQVKQPARMVLTVLDSSTTNVVRTLFNRTFAAGSFTVVWDGRDDQGAALAPGTWPYQLVAFGDAGDTLFFATRIATIIGVVDTIPGSWSLEQNDPNPFCGETRIRLQVPRPSSLRLEVLNESNGSVVRTLLDGSYATGAYAITWDGRDDHGATLPDGDWPYRLVARDSANDDVIVGQRTATIACGTPLHCLQGAWAHETGDCDARVAPGQPDSVTFMVNTSAPLAGLQGEFQIYPPGPLVTRITATGPAAGMHLVWRPTVTGARFALFAESGAPIPPSGVAGPVPVLRVTLASRTPLQVPVTLVSAADLFGSDEHGQAVPECPYRGLPVIPARVCAGSSCDYNADGSTDVRDLVLMAHCFPATDSLEPRTSCTNPGAIPDCDRDGARTIGDVICCAMRILRTPACPDCPPDTTTARPAPEVGVALGTPEYDETGVSVPLTMTGMEALGGVLVRLSYPADRYDAAFDTWKSAPWLVLTDAADGIAALGLVRLDAPTPAVAQLESPLRLRLTLKPGAQHGGSVSFANASFSGTDGVRLAVAPPTAIVALTGSPGVELSAASPNPFNGRTQFTLTLDRAAEVRVGVYDLGGRRVATLRHGTLDAGPHAFEWNGARDDGSPAAGGIYFYSATVGTSRVSRKMILLGH